jgi:hypothetical protein
MKEIHLKLKRFKCGICPNDVRFIRQVALNRHLIKEHKFETEFSCKEEGCQQSFVFRSQLETHINQKHRGKKYVAKKVGPAKNFICGECDRVYRTKYGLVR